MEIFFAAQMDYIFFIYGLSFTLLSATSFLLYKLHKELIWKWLALFGLLHGLNEWLDMGAILFGDSLPMSIVRIIFMTASFLCLFELSYANKNRTPLAGFIVYFSILIILVCGYAIEGLTGLNVFCRYLLGCAGILLAAWRIVEYAKNKGLRDQKMLVPLSIVLAIYALSQLITPKALIFPASMLNTATFIQNFHFPVQLMRMIAASSIAIIVWNYYVFLKSGDRASVNRKDTTLSVWLIMALIFILLGGWCAINIHTDILLSIKNMRLFFLGITLVLSVCTIFIFIMWVRRREDEDRVRMSEAQYRAIFDNTPLGVVLINPQLEIVSVNQRIKQWFPGVQVGSASKCYQVFNDPPTQDICPECPLVETMKDGKSREGVIAHKIASEQRQYRVLTTALFKASGEISGVIETVDDITDRLCVEEKLLNNIKEIKQFNSELEKAQAQLLQQEKLAAIGFLAAGVAHEINNPLGFIQGNFFILEEYINSLLEMSRYFESLRVAIASQDVQKVRELGEGLKATQERLNIEYIVTDLVSLFKETKVGIERIKNIVLNLRKFSRTDSGELVLANINDVIEGILGIVFNELKYKSELIKEYGSIPLISCNPQQLGQVFINLLVNAVQSIREYGKIYIRTFVKDSELIVEVADTGEGISEENLSKIFNPFFTTKEPGKGTGLGLSISCDIVKKHNGWIEVKSIVGKGTSFFIHFSLVKKEAA